jgi:hypothetical protein
MRKFREYHMVKPYSWGKLLSDSEKQTFSKARVRTRRVG